MIYIHTVYPSVRSHGWWGSVTLSHSKQKVGQEIQIKGNLKKKAFNQVSEDPTWSDFSILGKSCLSIVFLIHFPDISRLAESLNDGPKWTHQTLAGPTTGPIIQL